MENRQRIEARWLEQKKANTIQPLVPGLVAPLTTLHICPVSEAPLVPASFVPPKTACEGSGQFKIWVEGGLIQVKLPKAFIRPKEKFADRGRVQGFSAAARRRLMRKLAMLQAKVLPLFCTLTYPAEFPVDYRRWKNDLHKFARRFGRKFPGGAFIWRLEPQKRGAPHYHLLVYGVEFTGENVAWFHAAWYESVKSGDIKHFKHGVRCEEIRNRRGVASYVSKYIAKKQGLSFADSEVPAEVVDWAFVGRWWGIRFGGNLPESEVFSGVGLSYQQATKLLRTMRGFLAAQGCKVSAYLPGLTMFCTSPKSWAVAIEGLMGGHYSGNGSFQSIGTGVLH